MKKDVRLRFALIALSALAALFYLIPNTPLYDYMPQAYKNTVTRGITLGLDLQGGLHLVFEVEGDKAVGITAERRAPAIKKLLDNKKLSADVKAEGAAIVISATGGAANDEIRRVVEADYKEFELKNSDGRLVYALGPKEVKWIKDNAVDQALETIRNRVDAFGVAEPVIQRQGENEIVVQLPGIKDPKRAIELIGKTAQLEFKLVDEESPIAAELPSTIKPEEEAEMLKKFEGRIPEDDAIFFERTVNKNTGDVLKRPFLLKKQSVLTGELLSEAGISIDNRFNEPYVSIKFNPEGARLFEEVTGKYVKRRLAIILDNSLYSAPVIQEKISGGSAQITGTFTMNEARDLAIVLRAGSLPAPVKMLQNITVGPSLGRDSIAAGSRAALLALILVAGFMVFYYRFSGLIADLALVLNILLLLGAIAALKATLTLPGIAGVILAIGMAVDTNVLMFERIREELRAGKTSRAAVDSGYDKAFFTIVDSHVTTLITAAVLFQFGTGPIKGFAVTLSLGVTINLFTSLIGTKSVFDFLNSRKEIKELSI
jgi:preprotein translocase subunit SecD